VRDAAKGWWRKLRSAPLALLALVLAACRGDGPGGSGSGGAPKLSAAEVIAAHSASLMAILGVTGVYQGESHGRTVLRVMVYSSADSSYRRIPRRIEGYPVEIEVSGYIRPMERK